MRGNDVITLVSQEEIVKRVCMRMAEETRAHLDRGDCSYVVVGPVFQENIPLIQARLAQSRREYQYKIREHPDAHSFEPDKFLDVYRNQGELVA